MSIEHFRQYVFVVVFLGLSSSLTGCYPAFRQNQFGATLGFHRDLAFDGKRLLIGDSLWDVQTGTKIQSFSVKPGYVTAAIFSPDHGQVITAIAKQVPPNLMLGEPVKLWDVATAREIRRYVPEDGWVFDLQFSPDGKRIVAALTGVQVHSDNVEIWDFQSARQLLTFHGLWTPAFGFPADRYVSFSPDGRTLLLLSIGIVTVFDSATGKRVGLIKGEKGTTNSAFFVSAHFSPNGKLILTQDSKGVARTWDAKSGQQIRVFAGAVHNQQFCPYALFTPDGNHIVAGSDDGVAILWEVKSGKEIRRYRTPGSALGPVNQMSVSCDGKRLITICESTRPEDKRASLWNISSGRLITQFFANERVVGFSPFNEQIVTVMDEKPARLWDGTTGKVIRTYNNHNKSD